MSDVGSLSVAIDAPVLPGTTGGVAQFVASLIGALGKLDNGRESYTIVCGSQEQVDWLKRYSGPKQRFVVKNPMHPQNHRPQRDDSVSFPALLKRGLGPLLPAARYVQRLLSIPPPSMPTSQWPEVGLSDGFYEGLGCDVLHIPTQTFTLCALPSIYNPHDLQHLHYPQFFTPAVIAERETLYTAGCHYAHTITVGSQWIKDDIVRQYRVAPEKVQVIPEGPPTELYSSPSESLLAQVRERYGLQAPFAFYPAVTWPHKNHIRLLDAIARLRDNRGIAVRLVCTGSHHPLYWPPIAKRLEELKLSSQVKFLGHVPEEDLRAIYHLSEFLVLPTLFEACSLPIFEAWLEGLPVASSDATALPEQVRDAALLFEPRDVETIADAIEKMASDPELRRELRARGRCRLKDFDWARTAKAYRAVYRRAAGRLLNEEDRFLLAWDWMREPRREATLSCNA